ncbi:MAG: hypothetical protein QM520_03775 [Gammaproteobacteria bacterium]|nr:hypothetical protein [Gammaproteobacteria bacterium]
MAKKNNLSHFVELAGVRYMSQFILQCLVGLACAVPLLASSQTMWDLIKALSKQPEVSAPASLPNRPAPSVSVNPPINSSGNVAGKGPSASLSSNSPASNSPASNSPASIEVPSKSEESIVLRAVYGVSSDLKADITFNQVVYPGLKVGGIIEDQWRLDKIIGSCVQISALQKTNHKFATRELCFQPPPPPVPVLVSNVPATPPVNPVVSPIIQVVTPGSVPPVQSATSTPPSTN